MCGEGGLSRPRPPRATARPRRWPRRTTFPHSRTLPEPEAPLDAVLGGRVPYGRDPCGFREGGRLRIARVVARDAVILLFVFLALSPATVFAFNPPDPNSPGHHYGEYLHNWHLQTSQPTPAPGGGNNNNGGGVQNAFSVLDSRAAGPSSERLPSFLFHPISLVVSQLNTESKSGLGAWWGVLPTATFIAPKLSHANHY